MPRAVDHGLADNTEDVAGGIGLVNPEIRAVVHFHLDAERCRGVLGELVQAGFQRDEPEVGESQVVSKAAGGV